MGRGEMQRTFRLQSATVNMGLLNRIGDILRSNINDLIARAEDPERMLNAAIDDMKRQVAEAKSRVASSIADQSRLVTQRDREQKKANSWEEKAMVAVRAGRDDLAVEALSKKRDHQAAANQYDEQLETQRLAVDELKRALGELVATLEKTKRERNLLIARAKQAEAQLHLAATLNAAQENSARSRLELLEARVEKAEAQAEATWELASISSENYDDALSNEIEQLSAGTPKDELLELKNKMRSMGASTKKALPPGQQVLERSDEDLEAQIAQAAGETTVEDASIHTAEAEIEESSPADTKPPSLPKSDLPPKPSGEGAP